MPHRGFPYFSGRSAMRAPSSARGRRGSHSRVRLVVGAGIGDDLLHALLRGQPQGCSGSDDSAPRHSALVDPRGGCVRGPDAHLRVDLPRRRARGALLPRPLRRQRHAAVGARGGLLPRRAVVRGVVPRGGEPGPAPALIARVPARVRLRTRLESAASKSRLRTRREQEVPPRDQSTSRRLLRRAMSRSGVGLTPDASRLHSGRLMLDSRDARKQAEAIARPAAPVPCTHHDASIAARAEPGLHLPRRVVTGTVRCRR
jgi:hypothetical protein